MMLIHILSQTFNTCKQIKVINDRSRSTKISSQYELALSDGNGLLAGELTDLDWRTCKVEEVDKADVFPR